MKPQLEAREHAFHWPCQSASPSHSRGRIRVLRIIGNGSTSAAVWPLREPSMKPFSIPVCNIKSRLCGCESRFIFNSSTDIVEKQPFGNVRCIVPSFSNSSIDQEIFPFRQNNPAPKVTPCAARSASATSIPCRRPSCVGCGIATRHRLLRRIPQNSRRLRRCIAINFPRPRVAAGNMILAS